MAARPPQPRHPAPERPSPGGRLSRGNDLGPQPIRSMVAAGTVSADLAEQQGLC